MIVEGLSGGGFSRAVGILTGYELILEHGIVGFPFLSSAIHHCLGLVIVGVQIGIHTAIIELAVLNDVFGAFAHGGRITLFPTFGGRGSLRPPGRYWRYSRSPRACSEEIPRNRWRRFLLESCLSARYLRDVRP